MDPVSADWLGLGVLLALLVLTFVSGSTIERRHLASLRTRERRDARMPAVTFRSAPASWDVRDGVLVTGSVVISLDYFKRFVAGLRMLVGGRVAAYESLLDRARREALLRLKQRAVEKGCGAVIDVRIETSRIASSTRGGQGLAGIEVLAFGTGLRLGRPVA